MRAPKKVESFLIKSRIACRYLELYIYQKPRKPAVITEAHMAADTGRY